VADAGSGDRSLPEPAPARRASRVRGRLVVVAALVTVVVASGFGLQRELGPRPAPPGRAEASESGAWSCPHGGGDGWRAWVWVTNPGPSAVRVRITTFGSKGMLARSTFSVDAMHQAQRSVPATERAAATQVEYFGGWVAASTVVRSNDPHAVAAERCVSEASRQLFVPDGTTAGGYQSFVVVMNPFGQDAAFDVILRTDRRPPVRPGSLTPYVVKAGTSAALSLGDFVLQAPDEHLVSAELDVGLGRVIAGGLTVSAAGLRAEAAVPSPSESWVLPAARYGIPSSLALVNPGSRRADLEIIAQGDSSQKVLSGVGAISLGPGAVRLVELGDLTDAGVVIRSTNHVPIVATRRAAGERGDVATGGGAPEAAARWIVLPSLTPAGGRILLLLENPGRTDADVGLVFLGRGGGIEAPAVDRLTVKSNRMVVVDLSSALGARPITVVVTAGGGTIVAGTASYSLGGDGYASTLGEVIPASA
jgi:hypothetical protein